MRIEKEFALAFNTYCELVRDVVLTLFNDCVNHEFEKNGCR